MPGVRTRIQTVVDICKDSLSDYEQHKKAKLCTKFVKDRDNKTRDLLEPFEQLYQDYKQQIANEGDWLSEDVELQFAKKKKLAIGAGYQYLERQCKINPDNQENQKKRDQFLINLYNIFLSVAEDEDDDEEKTKIKAYLSKLSGSEQSVEKAESSNSATTPQDAVSSILKTVTQNGNGLQGFFQTVMNNPKIQEVWNDVQNNEQLREASEKQDIMQMVNAVTQDPNLGTKLQEVATDKELFSNILSQADNEEQSSSRTEYDE